MKLIGIGTCWLTLSILVISCSSDTNGESGNGSGGELPEANADSIFTWLKTAKYESWPSSSVQTSFIHGTVRTFINPTLETSLEDGADSHPKDSATVKELLETDGETLKGWAMSLKVQADSSSGDGWYWYENLSTTDGSSPVVSGTGEANCIGCHGGGSDYVAIEYPLP